MSQFSIQQRIIAEFLGTMTFCYIVSCADQDIYVGLGYFIAMVLFGGISGGHYNPAITLTQMIIQDGNMGLQDGLGYMLAQTLGGFVGVLLCFISTGGFKTPLINFDDTTYRASFSEFIGCIGFLFMVLTQIKKQTQLSKDPLIIYFLIATQLYVFRECAKISSAVLNPAVAITFMFFSAIQTNDYSKLNSLGVFLSLDFGAALCISVIYRIFIDYHIGDENLYEVDDRQPLVQRAPTFNQNQAQLNNNNGQQNDSLVSKHSLNGSHNDQLPLVQKQSMNNNNNQPLQNDKQHVDQQTSQKINHNQSQQL